MPWRPRRCRPCSARVKWGMAWYGVGDGWCFSCGGFAGHVKLTFGRGTSLTPVPPVTPIGMGKDSRGVDLESVDDIDERQLASWMKQAAAHPRFRETMNAPARSPSRRPRCRPARRGRADAGLCARHRPSRWARAGRHRHDGAAPGGGRHGSAPQPAERAGLRPRRHRHRRQHPPALRPLRRQPPLRRQADLRPAPGARRRAQPGRLHHPRVGRRARRASTCRSTASSSCFPGSDSSRRRATRRGTQVVVVETGGRPVVIAGDVAVWFGELDEPQTEGQQLVRALDPELVWLAHEHEPWRPTR